MIYTDDSSYKYLVTYGDNYVVLSKRSSVTADYMQPYNLPVKIQYFYPSYYSLETTRTFTTSTQFNQIQVTDDVWHSPDCFQGFVLTFILIYFCCFIFNGFTRFVRKGGIMRG